jgi:hypothetical protein
MKKMHYISPQIVTIPIKVRPLLTGSPFMESETISEGEVDDVPEEDWDDDEEGL